ncbi:MAG: hypothetical protein ACQEQF_09740 [Bacillota bacterium]
MENYFWLGLPLKTWVLIIIPTIIAGFLPFFTAIIINKKDDQNE